MRFLMVGLLALSFACGDDGEDLTDGGGDVAAVAGSWDAVQAGGQNLPYDVTLSGNTVSITDGLLSLDDDLTWRLDVRGTFNNPGAPPITLVTDGGTYAVRAETEDGLTVVDFVSEEFAGYTFAGFTDGEDLSFTYDMTDSEGGEVEVTFTHR